MAGLHPGQVGSSSQGHIEKQTKTNNHSHIHTHTYRKFRASRACFQIAGSNRSTRGYQSRHREIMLTPHGKKAPGLFSCLLTIEKALSWLWTFILLDKYIHPSYFSSIYYKINPELNLLFVFYMLKDIKLYI